MAARAAPANHRPGLPEPMEPQHSQSQTPSPRTPVQGQRGDRKRVAVLVAPGGRAGRSRAEPATRAERSPRSCAWSGRQAGCPPLPERSRARWPSVSAETCLSGGGGEDKPEQVGVSSAVQGLEEEDSVMSPPGQDKNTHPCCSTPTRSVAQSREVNGLVMRHSFMLVRHAC